ncbi:MAG TPA: cytochrome ubiquinol oxidase subunit I [Bryobacteraceae bacterium]|nr:cytochrome ubiquinol oxidase subunit I [Bryobacteraceae bacterium]
MDDALLIHRLHFAFTVTFHYLFPQLTMGLAPLIVIFKSLYLRTNNPLYNRAARFWAKVFGINFVLGVVTGIPMEFEFGTNWAQFSRLTGGVIGQPLVMEGVFSFFLESAFLGLFLYGERRLGRVGHWWAAFAVFAGSWLSGFFIIVTDAWMQYPVAFQRAADGTFQVTSFWGLLLNPWALIQYAHNMCGALITGVFVIAAVGAYYLLDGIFVEDARVFLRVAVVVGIAASIIQIFPTGDLHGKFMAAHQPVTVAAMEGLFKTETGAPIVILGQPDAESERIDNPLVANKVLSFLIYGTTTATVKGLNAFPKSDWPTNIPLLYYSYHIMAGLGTIFLAVMAAAAFLLWRRRLYQTQWMLWILLLCLPLPYIANTAGWMTAEVGRQPWLVYGMMRTPEGYSTYVHAGNGLFTLLGFMGLYALLAILFLFLVNRVIVHGPVEEPVPGIESGTPVTVV